MSNKILREAINLATEVDPVHETEIVEVDGVKATKLSGLIGIAGTVYHEEIIFSKNDKTYYFTLGTYHHKILLDQILSTFKFVE